MTMTAPMPWKIKQAFTELPEIAHDPRALDPRKYKAVMRFYRKLAPYFRPTIEGVEHLESGGAMIVANHGYYALDCPFFSEIVYRKTRRAIRGMGDRVLFQTPVMRNFLWNGGGVEGSPQNAHALLTAGELVYAMPGGAKEALAGEDVRYDLFWDGHYGYARAALRARVPIVPVAVIGSADLYRQLLTAQDLRKGPLHLLVRKLYGQDKYLPFVPFGLGAMPLPEQLHFIVGEPIAPPPMPRAEEEQAVVEAFAAEGRKAVEALVARGLSDRAAREARMKGIKGVAVRALARLRAPLPELPAQASAAE